jgi:Ni,Fe-hydrogenase III large subunit
MINPTLMDPVRLNSTDAFLERIRELVVCGSQPMAFFGTEEALIYCLMGKSSELVLLCAPFPPGGRYPALSADYPAFQIFERELYEEFGTIPIRHPHLKSVRHPAESTPFIEDYAFLQSESKLIHEVGVGPVHAGVIEPGHFRFLMRGEIVENLEIQLGWQHRAIIKMLCSGALSGKIHLAECIAGDTVIGHGTAFCGVVEILSGLEPQNTDIRDILLELERVAMHLSTLSALAGDVAYIMSQNLFAALRTTIINSTLSICGSRFGKRALCIGGVNYSIDSTLCQTLKRKLKESAIQIQNTAEAMFSNTSVVSRFDDTGKISTEDALRFGFTGVTAKASGIPVDARTDFPGRDIPGFLVQTESSGDVYARAHLRYTEALQSLELILELLDRLEPKPPTPTENKPLLPNRIAISITEGARGRIVHIAKAKDEQTALWYRIVDPSLVNWQALAMAVSGEQISDFPLCNKSFDLSYCGSDL